MQIARIHISTSNAYLLSQLRNEQTLQTLDPVVRQLTVYVEPNGDVQVDGPYNYGWLNSTVNNIKACEVVIHQIDAAISPIDVTNCSFDTL